MSNSQSRVQNTARTEPVFVISREYCQVVESWPLSDGDFPGWAQLRAQAPGSGSDQDEGPNLEIVTIH